MKTGEKWLRERLAAAPESLLDTMIDALPDRADSVAEALAQGAQELYGRVVRGSGGREDALPLLAADALLTHAFQAQAEQDPSGLTGLATRWSAQNRLGEVLP